MGRKSGFSDLRFFPGFLEKKLVVTKNRVPSIPAKMKNIFWGVEKSFFLQYALKTPYQLWKIDWKAWGTEKGPEKWFSQISIFFFFATLAIFFPQMEYALRICWYLTILFSQKIRP